MISAYTLGRLGEDAVAGVPVLSEIIRDENPDVRFVATEALGKIGPSSNTVPTLILALQDEDENVRFKAAEALYQLGESSRQAIPALIEAIWDGNWFVRRRAIDTLVQLSLVESDIPKLIGSIESNAISPYDHEMISSLVLALKPHAIDNHEEAYLFFDNALHSRDSEARKSAVKALGYLTLTPLNLFFPKNTLLALIEASQDDELEIRKQSIVALENYFSTRMRGSVGRLEVSQKIAFALIKATQDKNSEVRRMAVESLQHLTNDCPTYNLVGQRAASALVRALQDENSEVRHAAVQNLRFISANKQEITIALIAEIKDLKNQRLDIKSTIVELLPYVDFSFFETQTLEQLSSNIIGMIQGNYEIINQIINSLNSITHDSEGVQEVQFAQQTISNLFKYLENTERIYRLRNLESLHSIRIDSLEDQFIQEIILSLISDIENSNSEIRQASSDILGSLNFSSLDLELVQQVTSELLTAFFGNKIVLQENTVTEIASLAGGDVDEDVVASTLLKIMRWEDTSEKIRQRSAYALASLALPSYSRNSIDLPAEDLAIVLNTLNQVLRQDEELNVRFDVALLLLRLGYLDSNEFTSIVLKGLSSENAIVRLDTLAELDNLFTLNLDDEQFFRNTRARIVSRPTINQLQENTRSLLIEILESDVRELRYASSIVLSRINPKEECAIPTLSEAAKEKDWIIRKNAIDALEAFESEETFHALIDSMEDREKVSYYLASCSIYPDVDVPTSFLIRSLNNEDTRFMVSDLIIQLARNLRSENEAQHEDFDLVISELLTRLQEHQNSYSVLRSNFKRKRSRYPT